MVDMADIFSMCACSSCSFTRFGTFSARGDARNAGAEVSCCAARFASSSLANGYSAQTQHCQHNKMQSKIKYPINKNKTEADKPELEIVRIMRGDDAAEGASMCTPLNAWLIMLAA